MQTREINYGEMTDQELVDLFFLNGGQIGKYYFSFPLSKKSVALLSFYALSERVSGHAILFNLREKFRKEEINEFGEETKKS